MDDMVMWSINLIVVVFAGSIYRRLWNRTESWGGNCGLWGNFRWDKILDSKELLGS